MKLIRRLWIGAGNNISFSIIFLYQIILSSIMRIWDIPPDKLCRNHLLGEHRELHAIWKIITENKKGYSHHPETIRWRGKLKALYIRHNSLVEEMKKRGYNHKSPLNKDLAVGDSIQSSLVDRIEDQIVILRNKKCKCNV